MVGGKKWQRMSQQAKEIEIGAKLKVLRCQAGMTQRELGRAIGVSGTQILKYEQGKNRIAVSTFMGICDVLGASPMDFLDHHFQ